MAAAIYHRWSLVRNTNKHQIQKRILFRRWEKRITYLRKQLRAINCTNPYPFCSSSNYIIQYHQLANECVGWGWGTVVWLDSIATGKRSVYKLQDHDVYGKLVTISLSYSRDAGLCLYLVGYGHAEQSITEQEHRHDNNFFFFILSFFISQQKRQSQMLFSLWKSWNVGPTEFWVLVGARANARLCLVCCIHIIFHVYIIRFYIAFRTRR